MNLYEHVVIKEIGITGVIVDVIHEGKPNPIYMVESDEQVELGDHPGYPGKWPIFDCHEDEIEVIEQ